MLSPPRLLMRRFRNFGPENFKFARFWEGESIMFKLVYLLISMETYITCGFKGDEGPNPMSSLESANASSLKLPSYTYVFFTLC